MHEVVVGGRVKTQSEIPFSVVEYTAVFKKPILEAWTVPAVLVAAVLNALEPFGFKLDGVEAKSPSNVNEYALVFKRTPPGFTLTLGIGKLVIVAENLDWNETDQFIATAHVGIEAALVKSKAEIQSQQLTLAMHIQLKDRPRQEVTAPLLAPAAMGLLDGEVRFPGVILQRGTATIVVDASLGYANGLFVRIIREHGGNITLEEIAQCLRRDEERLFETLGLEGAL